MVDTLIMFAKLVIEYTEKCNYNERRIHTDNEMRIGQKRGYYGKQKKG